MHPRIFTIGLLIILSTSSLLVLGLPLALLLGCDRNGYPDIGEKLDVVEPCGPNSTTWVRSTCGTHPNGEEGHLITEVLIMGTDDFSPTSSPSGCYVHSELFYDSSARQWNGSFDASAGVALARSGFYYEFEFQPQLPVLQRTGAFREEIDPLLEEEFEYSSDGTTLTLTDVNTGEERVFRNVIDILTTLDPTVQADAFTFSRVFTIPIYNSLNRLLGFGSGGMTQYMSGTAEFAGMLEREVPPFDFTVHVEGLLMPYTVIDYRNFEDFTGIVLDGPQNTLTNTSGTGDMSGVLSFSLRTDVADPSQTVDGTFDYAGGVGVQVVNGFGDGGEGVMVLEGNTFTVATDVLIHPDFTADLPLP